MVSATQKGENLSKWFDYYVKIDNESNCEVSEH